MVYKYKKDIDRSRDTVSQKFPPYMSTAGKNLLHVSKITPKGRGDYENEAMGVGDVVVEEGG